ncbi:DUF317 domain-containing protein [Streptomyces sp. NPDC050095]|uniref:DUF317 domain-containing protein n=1 Tax=unclassified Streptomyces TaxID=2593676 RepID=UPI00343D9BD2
MSLLASAPLHTPSELPYAVFAKRDWLLDCHCATPVLELLRGQGWDVIDDVYANVHCASPDQRVYVGFLPETDAAVRGELWHVQVKKQDGAVAWSQTFGPDTPAQAVAGFLAALITFPNRSCACC